MASLTWRETSMDRWTGFGDDGQEVGFVELSVTGGGAHQWWNGWRRDGTPTGVDVGAFDSAEAAMAAVDAAG